MHHVFYPRADMIIFWGKKDLRLVLQPSERIGVDNRSGVPEIMAPLVFLARKPACEKNFPVQVILKFFHAASMTPILSQPTDSRKPAVRFPPSVRPFEQKDTKGRGNHKNQKFLNFPEEI
jgi:hypothetical protein